MKRVLRIIKILAPLGLLFYLPSYLPDKIQFAVYGGLLASIIFVLTALSTPVEKDGKAGLKIQAQVEEAQKANAEIQIWGKKGLKTKLTNRVIYRRTLITFLISFLVFFLAGYFEF